MLSPFPGMNPYLEQEDVWHDFHERFIPAAAEWLLPQVLPNYIVKIDQHAYIHELDAQERRFIGRPDVMVARQDVRPTTAPAVTGSLTAPVYGQLPNAIDVERQSFLEIRDRATRQIITVIELLSPSNKETDRDQYLAKRNEILGSSAHLVEIDLLRGGTRMPVEGLPPCDYCALVSRNEERPRVGLWPIALPDRLPKIPIPLRPAHGPATLDLQEILQRVYDAAGYAFYIYDSAPQPPLSPRQLDWMRQYHSV